MKTFKAAIKLYLNQILSICVSVFLILPFLTIADKYPYIFSGITTIVYFAIMYSVAWNIGAKDARKIPGFYPDKLMPLKLSLITAIVPVILLVIRLVFPDILPINMPFLRGESDFFVDGCMISGTTDFIYRLWHFPFAAFVPTDNIFAYVTENLVLPIAIFAGYYVGLTRFSLVEFFYMKIVYSGDPEKQNKRKKEDKFKK